MARDTVRATRAFTTQAECHAAAPYATGTDAEVVETVPLHGMDRSEHIGIMSSAYVPPVGPGGGVESLLDVIARARKGDAANESALAAVGLPAAVDDEDSAEDDEGEESAHRELPLSATSTDDDDEDEDGDARAVDGADWGGNLGVGVGFDFDADDSVWLSLDHADAAAVEGLKDAGAAAAAAAEEDADVEDRVAAMGDLLAHVCLHVCMAGSGARAGGSGERGGGRKRGRTGGSG